MVCWFVRTDFFSALHAVISYCEPEIDHGRRITPCTSSNAKNQRVCLFSCLFLSQLLNIYQHTSGNEYRGRWKIGGINAAYHTLHTPYFH